MKVLAFYLPQFHRTPENDEWWGEGYTEWTGVKNAKPMYKGHYQPKIPLNHNYYDLSDPTGNTWKWQAELAKKYGVYGFCIYHYWLGNGKQLLQTPMEILLKHPEIDIRYCVCWANHDWTRAWQGKDDEMLCKQEYGDQDEWKTHFEYLSQFFVDPRYIKVNNKPVFAIYETQYIVKLEEMMRLFDSWAKEMGFDGIYVISAAKPTGFDERDKGIDAYYLFEPGFSYYFCANKIIIWLNFQIKKIRMLINRIMRRKKCSYFLNSNFVYSIIKRNNLSHNKKKVYAGLFTEWDNSPRHNADTCTIFRGGTPERFGKVLKYLDQKIPEEDFIFINAWNEWGEGAYLEPDTKNGYQYLDQIKQIQFKGDSKNRKKR